MLIATFCVSAFVFASPAAGFYRFTTGIASKTSCSQLLRGSEVDTGDAVADDVSFGVKAADTGTQLGWLSSISDFDLMYFPFHSNLTKSHFEYLCNKTLVQDNRWSSKEINGPTRFENRC